MRLLFRKKSQFQSTQISLTVENPTLSKLLLGCDCLHQPAIFLPKFYWRSGIVCDFSDFIAYLSIELR